MRALLRKHLGAVAGVTFTTACVHTGATMLNASAKLPPICTAGVQLFTSPDKVGQQYHEIAVLTSTGDADLTSEEGMVNSQRKKAAKLGANGIILGEQKDPSTGAKIADAFLGTGADRKGKSIAIYIPADSDRVKEVCAEKVANR